MKTVFFMKEIEIHQREKDNDTESFLQENIKTFETDAVFLLKLMLNGERLTGKDVMQKYGIHDRRLRDLHISGKCEKAWKLNEKGKRMYVEYFIPKSHQQTKQECIEKHKSATEHLRVVERTLVKVFELPDDKPSYPQQQSLFP
jgi:hypothetical protein